MGPHVADPISEGGLGTPKTIEKAMGKRCPKKTARRPERVAKGLQNGAREAVGSASERVSEQRLVKICQIYDPYIICYILETSGAPQKRRFRGPWAAESNRKALRNQDPKNASNGYLKT